MKPFINQIIGTKQSIIEVMKYGICGVINNLSAYIFYLFLLHIFDYKIAYTITYVCSVIVSFALNIKFTFKEAYSLQKLIRFSFCYSFLYLVGLLSLQFLIETCSLNNLYAPIVNLFVMLPLSFLFTRKILKG